MIGALANGKIERYATGNKTVHLVDGYKAILSLDEHGYKKSWLLTGWEINKPDAFGQFSTKSESTQNAPTFSRRDLGAGLRQSWMNDIPSDSKIALGNEKSSSDLQEINRIFNDDIEKQIHGELPYNHIYRLGKPSDILLNTGIPDLEIELPASRLKQKSEAANHPFPISDVKNLPAALQKPIAIFSYGDREKAQNIIVELKNKNRNFLVGLSLNYSHNGIAVNSIRGLFPKDTVNWLN